MTPQDTPAAKKSAESEVWNAIAAFEQILEAMPDDRVALETLYEAYEQIGDAARSVEYLCRLGESIANEGDAPAAQGILDKLAAHENSVPAARQAAERLRALLSTHAPTMPAEAKSQEEIRRKPSTINSELTLAWNLRQAKRLTDEEYSSVVQDLTDILARKTKGTVSVLHALHDRNFKDLDKVLAFLSKDSGFPLVSLSNFEIQRETMQLLPVDFMVQRGALVFETMGKDALVAVLNPYNRELQSDVQKLTECSCHFYLVNAADFDNAVENVRKAIKLSEEQG